MAIVSFGTYELVRSVLLSLEEQVGQAMTLIEVTLPPRTLAGADGGRDMLSSAACLPA
jgi:hypothetical protein